MKLRIFKNAVQNNSLLHRQYKWHHLDNNGVRKNCFFLSQVASLPINSTVTNDLREMTYICMAPWSVLRSFLMVHLLIASSVPLHSSWKLQMISATVFSNDWSDRRGFSCVLRDHDDVPHFQLVHHSVTYEHKCGFKGENLVLKVIWLSGLNMNWNSKPFFLFLPGSNFKVRISSRKLLTWEFAD